MMTDVWDKNWNKNIVPDVHPELINLVKHYSTGKKILEIGFGSGGDLTVLSRLGFNCWGLEKSKVAYDFSKKQNKFKSVLGDGEKAPFEGKEFNLIFHQGVLEHFKDSTRFLKEHRRLLKEDGVTVIDVPHKWNLFTIYKHIRMLFGDWYGGWERSYSASELKSLINKNGFETLEIKYRGIFPHQWGKLLFPEKIVENKIAARIFTKSPLKIIQRAARALYDKSKFLRVISSYNIIIVARKRNFKIGFDGRYAEGDLVGIGKFILSLVSRLSKLGVSCVIFYSKKPKFEIKGKNIKPVILGNSNRYIFEQILLPLALKKEKLDLYHALGNIGVPIFCPVPAVLTVHDIIPLEIKKYFSYSPLSFLSKLSYETRLKSSLVKAVKIATDSSYVKEELENKLGVNSKKIGVIYLGSPEFIKSGRLPKNLTGQKYILNHGGIDIRKNLNKLIEAFVIFRQKHAEIKLVITGKNERIRKELDGLIKRLNLKNSVIFTGYLDEKTLANVIKNAEMICYPTISEGFGFPVLEGFGAGVPVISSMSSSIPEVAGGAALLINPNNMKEISNAMEKVLTDKKLRERMVLKGREQYNKFDWEKTANEYLDLYNSI